METTTETASKRLLCNGPDALGLAASFMNGTPVNFWVSVGEISDTNPPDRNECYVMGMERGEEPHDYHLAVQIKYLKTPQWQYFTYSTLTLEGEWVGCLDIGHKAYKGHSFRME